MIRPESRSLRGARVSRRCRNRRQGGAAGERSPTQEEQIDYARILRFAKTGWTKELRADYFRWFLRAANYKGGASFDLFIGEIKADALATMTEEEKLAIKDVLDAKPEAKAPSFTTKPMQFVKAWTLDDLGKSLGVGLEGNRNFTNGRNMFGAATCFACHRFNQRRRCGRPRPDQRGRQIQPA
jgi:hypothetical protein